MLRSHFNGKENGHVTEVVTLMEGRMVMLLRWSV